MGARNVNSIERKIRRILNSKREEELEEAVASLAQESPNEIKRVLRHYLGEVVDKFLDLDINYMTKVVLFEGWVAPLIEPNILIAELILRVSQSESLNVARSLLLFHLMAKEDYFNELKEIIHSEIKSIRNNRDRITNFHYWDLERHYLAIIGSIGDYKSQTIVKDAISDIKNQKFDEKLKNALFWSLKLIQFPKKGKTLWDLYNFFSDEYDKNQVIEIAVSTEEDREGFIQKLLKKAKDETKIHSIRRLIEEREEELYEFQPVYIIRDQIPPNFTEDKMQYLVKEPVTTIDFNGDSLLLRDIAEGLRFKFIEYSNPFFGNESALIDPLPHQLLAIYEYLIPQNRLRFLLADDAGAGKTIMAGLYIREKLFQNLISRILIVSPAGLVNNWQDELLKLFRLDFSIVTGRQCRENEKIEPDRAIISLDTAWRVENEILQSRPWDLIIIDEAHKLTLDIDKYNIFQPTKRYQIASILSERTTNLLLLTATPHQGKDFQYFGLWKLLEPKLFLNPDAYSNYFVKNPAKRNDYIIRRLKEQLIDMDGKPIYPTRECKTVSYHFSPEERELYEAVTEYVQNTYETATLNKRAAVGLAMTVIQRRLASSTYALFKSLERRLNKLKEQRKLLESNIIQFEQHQSGIEGIDDVLATKTADEEIGTLENEENEINEEAILTATNARTLTDLDSEIRVLHNLLNMTKEVLNSRQESKWLELVKAINSIKDPLNQEPSDQIKILIFTEYRDTQEFLVNRLSEIGFSNRIATINGTMNPDERKRQINLFRSPGYRFLVATDAAGEGINLQFAWVLINYDIPWNPARLEQRMGRIHRYNQKHDPVYIINVVAHDTREGRVLEVLLEKLDYIRKAFKETFPDERGEDKVFDVIGEQFVEVPLNKLITKSIFEKNGMEAALVQIEKEIIPDRVIRNLKERESADRGIQDITEYLPYVRKLEKNAETYRLLPSYIRNFFRNAASYLDFYFRGDIDSIFQIEPYERIQSLTETYPDPLRNNFSFSRKEVFAGPFEEPKATLLHPGERVFDCINTLFLERTKSHARRGAVFLDPNCEEPYLFCLIRSDVFISNQFYSSLSPAPTILKSLLIGFKISQNMKIEQKPVFHLLDVRPTYSSGIRPELTPSRRIPEYLYELARKPDFIIEHFRKHFLDIELQKQQVRIATQIKEARKQIRTAFTKEEFRLGDIKTILKSAAIQNEPLARQKLKNIEIRINNLRESLSQSLNDLMNPNAVTATDPEILLFAAILPTSPQQDAQEKYDHINSEAVAVRVVKEYEIRNNGTLEDVSSPYTRAGYDLISERPDGRRFIEIKGRLSVAPVDLTDNEWTRAAIERERYWLYVVYNCATENPELWILQDPFGKLLAKRKQSYAISSQQFRQLATRV